MSVQLVVSYVSSKKSRFLYKECDVHTLFGPVRPNLSLPSSFPSPHSQLLLTRPSSSSDRRILPLPLMNILILAFSLLLPPLLLRLLQSLCLIAPISSFHKLERKVPDNQPKEGENRHDHNEPQDKEEDDPCDADDDGLDDNDNDGCGPD